MSCFCDCTSDDERKRKRYSIETKKKKMNMSSDDEKKKKTNDLKVTNYTGNALGRIAFHGHSWNVPRISIPSVFGYTNWGKQKLSQGSDTWFYCGHVTDIEDKQYTILSFIARNPKAGHYAFLLNIGNYETQDFYVNGPVIAPFDDKKVFICLEPKDEQYHLGLEYQGNKAFYRLAQDNKGMTGMMGAKYQLFHEGFLNEQQTKIGINIYVQDLRGSVLELMAGNCIGFGVDENDIYDENKDDNDIYDAQFAPNHASYQMAQPLLKVYNSKDQQSTLTICGKTVQIKSGEIWLDRQIYDYNLSKTDTKPLYVGNWMYFRLKNVMGDDDNPYIISLANIMSNSFPVDKNDRYVWQSCPETGYPPVLAEGCVYYPIPNKIGKYYRMNNGGKFLAKGDFEVNILNTKDPDKSPHWKSPTTQVTYATAWKIDLKLDSALTVYMFAMVDKCEFGGNIWETACLLYADPLKKDFLGYGWAEQMGYN